MNILLLQCLAVVMFLTIVFLHLTKKNTASAFAYGIQSFIVSIVFLMAFFETGNVYLGIMVLLTLIVKMIAAPIFLMRLIRKHALAFSVSTYLNTPFTLGIIATLTVIAHSQKFHPLTGIVLAHQAVLALALSSFFLSLFLIVNRKGAISQILGMLSLENSIVVFIIFAGLEQSPSLQIGVIVNIFVWIMIATVFASMLYKHFGSHDVTSLKHLKD